MDPSKDFYSFVKLTDLPASLALSVRIDSLRGNLTRSSIVDLLEDETKKGWGTNIEPYPPFYLTLRLYSANKPLTPPHRTPFKPFKKGWVWNTTIDLGYPIRDLPLDAQLGITIWDSPGLLPDDRPLDTNDEDARHDRVIGGTTLKLFGKKGTLKKAQHRCTIHLAAKADGSVITETSSKGIASPGDDGHEGMSEMSRLEKLIKRHDRLDLPRLKWLDKQTYRVIESIHAKESEKLQDELWLYLDLPRFEWPIVWCEDEVMSESHHGEHGFASASPSGSTAATAAALASAASTSQPVPSTSTTPATAQGTLAKPHAPLLDRTLFTIPDPESQRENPIEAKHRRLVRAQRSRRRGLGSSGLGGPGNLTLARNLKPDKKARDEIEDILSSPPTRELTDKESDLLWTYRFYLTKNPRGLTKFLKAVSWADRVESRMAVETVLPLWGGASTAAAAAAAATAGQEGETAAASIPVSATGSSAVEIGDVLELLGPACKGMDRAVRRWAVDRLAERHDEEISLYLLQLVQALKLDDRDDEMDNDNRVKPTSAGKHTETSNASSATSGTSSANLGPLAEFLVARALAATKSQASSSAAGADARPTSSPADAASFSLLVTFHWYLSVECSDDRWGLLYRRIRRRLERGLDQGGEVGKQYLSIIRRQEKMVGRLGEMARNLRNSKDGRPKKIERLKEWAKDEKAFGLGHKDSHSSGSGHETTHDSSSAAGSAALGGLPLPLDPTIRAKHIKIEQCSVFKSNLFPLLIWFDCEGGSPGDNAAPGSEESAASPGPTEYAMIFKSGDDLRQDQLVLQLFQLMDRLLLNENLDLKLTPYRVLATAPKEGMVQFIKSKTLASIVTEHGSLNEYLREAAAASASAVGGDPSRVLREEEQMDRFVRSCAGYCVVTYLLGVGDRHLDNLLLAPDGRFFHVDFGYILNRDPKPFPPPVKVSKEMVDCMGGPQSPNYARFRQLCFTAFSILRKNANLILNLVSLMQDAPVGDIKVEPDKAVGKVLEKFRLDLSEPDAKAYFDELLQQSSYLTVMFDRLHDAAQFFRS